MPAWSVSELFRPCVGRQHRGESPPATRPTTLAPRRTTQAARGGARTTRAATLSAAQNNASSSPTLATPNHTLQEHQHALGLLLEEIGDRRGPAHPRLADRAEQRAEHAQQRPEATAPPVSLRQDDAHASAASGEDHAEQRAEHAQRPEATAPPAAEDPKRALVREPLQKDLSRMSLLLERLDELLSA